MAQTRIVTYRQDRPADWLKDHPHETWRCDIFPEDGSDHHGVGALEAQAIMNAAMAFLKWSTRPSVPVSADVRLPGFPAMTFRSSNPKTAEHVGPSWSTPSQEDAYNDGKASGLHQAKRGQFYRAGGPWVPKIEFSNDEGWKAYCNQCAKVNEVWLQGWADGQALGKEQKHDDQ